MSDAKMRKYHSPEFKAKVGLEAVRGVKTINEIRQEYEVHPVQVGQWKKAIQEQASALFEGKCGPAPVAAHREPDRLYSEIGKLKWNSTGSKKVRDQPVVIRVDRQIWRGGYGSAMHSGERVPCDDLCVTKAAAGR